MLVSPFIDPQGIGSSPSRREGRQRESFHTYWLVCWGRQEKGKPAKKLRGAQETRARILAFQEIYRTGYQSADIESVLGVAALTKGALYYHFSNKEALGLEMVDQGTGKIMQEKWLRPLQSANDPIAALIEVGYVATRNVSASSGFKSFRTPRSCPSRSDSRSLRENVFVVLLHCSSPLQCPNISFLTSC